MVEPLNSSIVDPVARSNGSIPVIRVVTCLIKCLISTISGQAAVGHNQSLEIDEGQNGQRRVSG